MESSASSSTTDDADDSVVPSRSIALSAILFPSNLAVSAYLGTPRSVPGDRSCSCPFYAGTCYCYSCSIDPNRGGLKWYSGMISLQPIDIEIRQETISPIDRKSTRLNSSHRCISY